MDSLNESVREGLSASQQLEETSKTLTALSQTLDKYAGSFKVGKA
jgi:methyl-accepting chemotaxis protein